jgi:hypothetical protein
MQPHNLRRTLNRLRPGNSRLDELLHLRPQLPLRQRKIVHSPRPQNLQSRKALARTIHQTPARLAEIARHERLCAHRFRLCKGSKIVLTADVLEMRIGDGDVGHVGGGADFAAVGAVADVAVYKPGTLDGLLWRERLGEIFIGKMGEKGLDPQRRVARRRSSRSRSLLLRSTNRRGQGLRREISCRQRKE